MRWSALLLLLIFAASCHNTWTSQTRHDFYRDCNAKNLEWAKTPARAQDYCDCVFVTMTRKYPIEAEAMKKMDSVLNDPDILACKVQIGR